jgi:hypothetical protein
MIAQVVPVISALEAQAAANLFLSDHLPDRYCASDPRYDQTALAWRVPVLMAYRHVGTLGQVGEILVNAQTKEVLAHTPWAEMRESGRRLYEQNREAIEAAFLQARN